MSVTYNGRPFNAGQFSKDIEKAMLQSVKEQLQERLSALRHPETGEFPTVLVLGDRLDDLRLSIEGSETLLAYIKTQMSEDDAAATTFITTSPGQTPKAFISYSFDNSDLARRIANGLMERGIDVWWAEWEMKAGDSLRQRIDEGLKKATHFIVLLTPESISKPWVNQEMDAGLVRKIEGQARFIALRHNLPAKSLPPLLAGMLAPEVMDDSFEENIRDLANDIHGVSRKPALGPVPATVSAPQTGFTAHATATAKVFVEGTRQAMFGDPQLTIDELARTIDASTDDVEDALHELRDMVQVSFNRVLPRAELYATFDKHFMEWSPEDDALRIAADLVNDDSMPSNTEEVAARYGWDRRRMNPALSYLLARKLIMDYSGISTNGWLMFRVMKTDATRRYVKSRS